MGTGLAVLGMMVLPMLVAILVSPVGLVGWLKDRREEAIRRQIVLTDAIDRRLGAIVAPVVRKRLWGPWEIRMAVPFTRPATVGTALAVAHEVLSVAERMNPSSYQIVLTPKEGSAREAREIHASESAGRRPGGTIAAT